MRAQSRPRLEDIAEQTGLSVATVSRALHRDDSPYVSLRTRSRVREVAQQLGYRPDARARSLAMGSSRLINIWLDEAYSPYYSHLCQELHRITAASGYCQAVQTALPNPGWGVADGLADGLIVIDALESLDALRGGRETPSVPTVTLGIEAKEGIDAVLLDLRPGVTALVQHLLTQFDGPLLGFTSPYDVRWQIFEDACKAADREYTLVRRPDIRRDVIREFFRDWIRKNGAPAAIFCHNDDAAVAVCRALFDLGLRVPEDVGIAGCDDLEEGRYMATPLTTVGAPLHAMCEAAWELLLNRIRKPDSPVRHIHIPSELIVRESTQRS